jgi:hypothetical protein
MLLYKWFLRSSAFQLSICAFLPVVASAATCNSSAHLKACSYEAVNGSCTVTIDRSYAITPPTIYIRQGECVEVEVKNSSPFESLSLDLKSVAPQPPADQIANGFTSITSAIGALSVVTNTTPNVAETAMVSTSNQGISFDVVDPDTNRSVVQAGKTLSVPLSSKREFQDTVDSASSMEKQNQISHAEAQRRVQEKFNQIQRQASTFDLLNREIDSYTSQLRPIKDPFESSNIVEILGQVHQLVQPLSPQLCTSFKAAKCPFIPETGVWDIAILNGWRQNVDTQFKSAIDQLQPADKISASPRIKDKLLEKDINDFAAASGSSQPQIDVLNKKLSALNTALGAFAQTEARLSSLQKVIDGATDQFNAATATESFPLPDSSASEGTIHVISYTLNASNRFTVVSKRISGDKYQDENAFALANIGNTNTKVAVTTITVQFEKEPRVELSGGIIFPITPYHSFVASQPYSSTPCTTNCTVVQENKTLSVTPVVVANIRLTNDFIWPTHQRSTLFFTLGAGYNSAVSAPAFVAGLSFSYRMMVFNFLADVSQDTHLTGGYAVNRNLYGATAPTTTTYYGVKFAPGISIRVPLNSTSQ